MTIPVVSPIHPSVSYIYDDLEELDAALGGAPDHYVYHRYGNPTVHAFERAVAGLETFGMTAEAATGVAAFAASSGMAAIHLTLLALGVGEGATVAAAQDCYGATHAIVEKLLPTMGVRGLFVDTTELAQVERVLAREKPAILIAETISNPLLKVTDVAALARLCHDHGALLVIDNTFATPMLYRPLIHGADVVVHSATKYLGGHGDVMGGVIIAKAEHKDVLWEMLKTTGAVLGPQEAWLLSRGLKTLPLRMERQCASATQVAAWLTDHPLVERVIFPGSPDHPQHGLAKQMFGGAHFGAMIAFEIRDGSRDKVFAFFNQLQMIQPATSLGDIYSLVLYPAHSSHRALSPEQRRALGISDRLVRLSVGIEAVEDITADLEQALARVGELG
jgi:cystathionine gamma-synthase/methionine-gamma-lyase